MPGAENREDALERAVEKWRGQSRKGFLELCIMSCIRSAGRTYGFAMLERLRTAGLDIGEGSMYPLLTRLVREGMLTAAWDTPVEGHARKYYSLSSFGVVFLERIQVERAGDLATYEAIVAPNAKGEPR